jgi:hypothetical protein
MCEQKMQSSETQIEMQKSDPYIISVGIKTLA